MTTQKDIELITELLEKDDIDSLILAQKHVKKLIGKKLRKNYETNWHVLKVKNITGFIIKRHGKYFGYANRPQFQKTYFDDINHAFVFKTMEDVVEHITFIRKWDNKKFTVLTIVDSEITQKIVYKESEEDGNVSN